MTAAAGAWVRTYALVLPANWGRISLRGRIREQVVSLVDQVVASTPKEISPDEVAPKRHLLEHELQTRAQEAAAKGGIDLYLPVQDWHGYLVSASFVVAEVAPAAPETSEAARGSDHVGPVMAELLRAEGSRPVEVGGTVFVRGEVVRPPGDTGPRSPSRQVRYMTAVPGDERTWTVVTFGCVGDDVADGVSGELLVELFDAIMSTWRWVREGDGA